MISRLSFNIEEKITKYISDNIVDIKVFFVIFSINILIYGQKIFFYNLACDDYGMLYSSGEELARLGRWMGGISSQYIFTGSIYILPYINGIIGVFSFTLAGFLTAKYLKRKNLFEISIITLLISVMPMVGHILYFNVATVAWIATAMGVIGLLLLYNHSKIIKIFGFILLVVSIGIYQIIIQIALAMIILKAIIEIIDTKNAPQINTIIREGLLYILLIFMAFIVSSIINTVYIDYYNLTVSSRYEKSLEFVGLSDYINRILRMYSLELYMAYSKTPVFLYKLMAFIGIIGAFYTLLRKKHDIRIRILSTLLLSILILSIPLIVYLPYITGNAIPIRSHYTIGWVIAGFFVIQLISFSSIFKILSYVLAIIIIIINVFYINVFFDVTTRQTKADINRANQIVNRIRINNNYTREPIKFKIVGQKSFPVIGWHSYNLQAFTTEWSKYPIFKNFTDFKFQTMRDDEYKEIVSYLVNRGEIIHSYPSKNSIFVDSDKVVLFLNPEVINKKIMLLRFSKLEPSVKSIFNLYQENNTLYYYKTPCIVEDTKQMFFLHVYPNKLNELPERQQKYGFLNMDFKFNSYGTIENNNTCIASRELPSYAIKTIKTGQYESNIVNWEAQYTFDNNSTDLNVTIKEY